MAKNFFKIYEGASLAPRSTDPTSPAEGDLQFADGTARSAGLWQYTGGAWEELAAGGGGGSATEIAFVKDEKASGTNGGTFTSGSFQTRTLNTLSGDTSWVSLSSNRFTLNAGTYFIEGSAPAYTVGGHQAKVVQDPGGSPTDVAIGSNERCDGSDTIRSHFYCKVTLGSSTAFEVQHRCDSTVSNIGFGRNVNFGVNTVYTQVKITKVA